MKVFDMHVHVFPDAQAPKAVANLGSYYHIKMTHEGTYKSFRENLLNADGFERCLVHATATAPRQTRNVNEFISKLTGNGIYGFGSVHPNNDNVEEEIDRLLDLGLAGIKIHNDFQGFDADSEKAFRIYKYAEGRLPILFHAGDTKSDRSHPERIRRVHDMFPRLKIIVAHLGGYTKWDEAEKCLVGTGVWLDTSSTLQTLPPERIERIIRRHGIKRCLFGTDFPMHDPTKVLEKFLRLGFTEREFEDILWNNAHEFLGIE